jgi:hypothetical protein
MGYYSLQFGLPKDYRLYFLAAMSGLLTFFLLGFIVNALRSVAGIYTRKQRFVRTLEETLVGEE